ncbi:hypothetical protein PVL29_008440 [Vitis rotundifolia]|uniref:Uncharacterized protein n=1 Tax=Vitis rotundifolia TaxID=103349 RepID=A0AA38ZXL3_VITRO|nr:hypothetical protein PVL29_008440 [Vitis rotundifolia]
MSKSLGPAHHLVFSSYPPPSASLITKPASLTSSTTHSTAHFPPAPFHSFPCAFNSHACPPRYTYGLFLLVPSLILSIPCSLHTIHTKFSHYQVGTPSQTTPCLRPHDQLTISQPSCPPNTSRAYTTSTTFRDGNLSLENPNALLMWGTHFEDFADRPTS